MAFVPDLPALKFVPDPPPAEPAATPKANGLKRVGEIEESLLGPSQILGSALLNAPAAAAHAALDLYHRISGQETPTADKFADAISVHPGAAGKQLAGDIGGGIRDAAQSLDAAAGGIPSRVLGAGQSFLNDNPTLQDVVHQAVGVASDAGNLLPLAGAAKTGNALVDQILAANAERSTPKFRSSEGSPVATTLAGTSGRQALILHNQALANATLGGEAGVPSNGPLNYDTLKAARGAPSSVYERAAKAIPTGPLSKNATDVINAAGRIDGTVDTGGSDVQANVQSIRNQLLAGPQTGQQVIRNMRKLRQEGFTNIASDDVSNQQLGKAQVDMANALEQHVSDSIPPGADVDMAQLAAARTALAKNFAVQSALRGPHVDLQAIARMQRADPDLLTGNLKDAADFANDHPEVATLPNPTTRYTGGPSVVEDVKKLNPLMRPIGSALEALGGWAGRRLLTGNTEAQIQNARTANPGGDLAEAFAPKPPGELALQPPPGTAFEPKQPDMFGNSGGGGPSNGAPGVIPPVPGLSVGEGRASPGASRTKSGPTDYGRNLIETPPAPPAPGTSLADLLSVGEGRASPGASRVRSGPTDYGRNLIETPPSAPTGLSVGEGKASPTSSSASGGPSGYGADLNTLLGDLLSVGEGKASPSKSKVKSGPSDYAKNLQQRLGPLGDLLSGE